MGGAPGGVGPALAQPGHQHLTGAGTDGQQRVIAPLAGVPVAAGALLGQAVGLADGGVEVDGQGRVAGTSAGGPGPGQQFPADPVQLADVAPPEATQEGPQSGRRLDHAAQHPPGATGTQRISVVDAVAASQSGGHQRHQLVAGVGPARGISQVEVPVNQLGQAEAPGQGGRQEQPGIVYQAVVVEIDADAVGGLKWQHLKGAPFPGLVICTKTIIPDSEEHPLTLLSHLQFLLLRWIRA